MTHPIHYWNLMVPEYVPMAITTLLAGAVVTTGTLPNSSFWLLAVSLSCIVGAFNSFNAIADKEIDKINSPHRPIPSKKIEEKHALYFSIGLYVLALLLASFINTTAFIIILGCVVLTAAYSYPKINLKQRFLLGTLTVTLFYAVLCFLAGWALSPTQRFPLEIATFLFLMGFGLAITKDFMDLPGDAFHRKHTLPVKLGYLQSIVFIILTLTISFALLTYIIYIGLLPQKFYLLDIFYPLMLFNVYSYKHHSKSFLTTHLFRTTMVFVMMLEIAMSLIVLFV
ncbi:MAG: UbiA family prenyltransferase [archaeon]